MSLNLWHLRKVAPMNEDSWFSWTTAYLYMFWYEFPTHIRLPSRMCFVCLFVCLFACLFVSLRIQSPCQMMIGVYNHLLSKVFGFHYHSQKGIGSLAICSIFSLFPSLQQYSCKICFVWFPKTELFKEGEPVFFLFSGRLTNQRSWFFEKNTLFHPEWLPSVFF